MPEGVVQWIDEADQTARVVRGGHEYRASLADVAPHARRAGVRVHFDEHDENGVPTARNVALLEGTRRSRRQRRFGDLTGARRPGDKAETTAHKHLGIDVETQPAQVAGAWVRAMTGDRIDDAITLYAPDVVFHVGSEIVRGSPHVRTLVDAADVRLHKLAPEMRVDDRFVQIDWPPEDDLHAYSTMLLVRSGRIVEQWTEGAEPEPVAPIPGEPSVLVVRHGDVADAAAHYGEEKIAGLLQFADDEVLFARLKLGWSDNPKMDKPATAEATVDANGTIYRAHAGGHSLEEAIDVLVDKLRHRFEREADRERHRPSGLSSGTSEWQHGNLATHRPSYFARPKVEREIVRHKTFAPGEMTVDEALFDMEQLDYDFFLFTELASGERTLLHRDGGELAAAQLNPHDRLELGSLAGRVKVDPNPAPRLAVSAAIERLDAGGEPHVFFRNTETDEANVLYRRYDGHYGLITPSGST